MQLRVIIEYDKVTDSFSAVCTELPGCASCGDTEEEAIENIKQGIELYLEPDEQKISPNARIYEVVI